MTNAVIGPWIRLVRNLGQAARRASAPAVASRSIRLSKEAKGGAGDRMGMWSTADSSPDPVN